MPLQTMSHLHQELTISSVMSSVMLSNCHFTILNPSFESMEKLKCLRVTQSKIAFIQKLKVESKINIKLK